MTNVEDTALPTPPGYPDEPEHPTPAQAWGRMVQGNKNFVAGAPKHPRQDVERRTRLAEKQTPSAALFGCSDSRLAAEIIFDMGLGDLFVIRNAGHVSSDSVVASLEYAVSVLRVPLIVVLAHDECGAVHAAIDSQRPDAVKLPPRLAAHIAPIAPSVWRVADRDPLAIGREHLQSTVAHILGGSELLTDAVSAGTLAIVGANYRLAEGLVVPDVIVGPIEPK